MMERPGHTELNGSPDTGSLCASSGPPPPRPQLHRALAHTALRLLSTLTACAGAVPDPASDPANLTMPLRTSPVLVSIRPA